MKLKILLFIFVIQFGLIQPAHSIDLQKGLSIKLIDEEGLESSIAKYNGFHRLVFFGYTYCPDICPLTLFQVSRALKSIDVDKDLRVLFISIDPKRDTPEVLAKYTDAFHPSLIGLTGDYESIMQLTGHFRTTFGFTLQEANKEQSLSKEEYENLGSDVSYTPYHSSQIYLLGKDGELLDIIGYGSQSGQIADKILEYIRN
jgi:protein SCO1/2